MTDPTDNQPPSLETQFSELNEQLTGMSSSLKSLQKRVQLLSKEAKQADKKSRTRQKAPPKKLNIDSKLASFIKVDSAVEITKAEVMKHISTYIKENNLQTQEDKRQFVPNKQLMKIFGTKESKPMTFVEINKYITQYLTPIAAPIAAAASN